MITNINELSDKTSFNLISSKKKDVGILKFDQINIVEEPTFIDYLRSGWGISMIVAIDFTGSNGEISDP